MIIRSMRGDVFSLEKLTIKPILHCLRTSSLSRMGWQFSSTWILDRPSVQVDDLPVSPFTLLPQAAKPVAFETADAAQQILIHNYFHLVAISVLLYDHLMTLGNEVDYLWRRPKTGSAYWFFLHRYFAFFGNIVVMILGFITLPAQSCERYNLFRQLMLIFSQILVCVLLTLRIYALYSCSLRILAYMVGSGAIVAGVLCWTLFGQKITSAGHGSGCHIGLSSDTAIRLAGAWEALFVYDSILFTLTMAETWRGRHEFPFNRASVPVIYLIFRDGAIYFAVMALANFANIMTFYFCGPFMRGGLSTFGSVISVTMMSRLMLNLHESADAGIHSTTLSVFTSADMYEPIELSTLRIGDVSNPSTSQGQSSRLDGSPHITSISREEFTLPR